MWICVKKIKQNVQIINNSSNDSQPINSFNSNINLDDIFSDFQPQNQNKQKQKQHQNMPKLIPKTNASLSLSPNTYSNDKKKRSKSTMITSSQQQHVQQQYANKRRGSVNKKDNNSVENELDVVKKTGYDISYFIDRDIAYKYLCIICENVCRSAVELACKKKETFMLWILFIKIFWYPWE